LRQRNKRQRSPTAPETIKRSAITKELSVRKFYVFSFIRLLILFFEKHDSTRDRRETSASPPKISLANKQKNSSICQLSRKAKVEAVRKLGGGMSVTVELPGNATSAKLTKAHYRKHGSALVGSKLNVWYPDDTEAGGTHWRGCVQSYYGSQRWKVVFEDGSYTKDLSLDQIIESIVSAY